ncbi:hypothetical protein LINPERHAP2_LOCUS19126, partial [Linum perenne]
MATRLVDLLHKTKSQKTSHRPNLILSHQFLTKKNKGEIKGIERDGKNSVQAKSDEKGGSRLSSVCDGTPNPINRSSSPFPTRLAISYGAGECICIWVSAVGTYETVCTAAYSNAGFVQYIISCKERMMITKLNLPKILEREREREIKRVSKKYFI